MTHILRIDASVRTGIAGIDPHGSQSRRLTELFSQTWQKLDPNLQIQHRDLGRHPPQLIDQDWISAEFGHADSPESAEKKLKYSNALVDELLWADLIIIGAPLYNFGMPANLKGYIDHIVRINKTYAFDLTQPNPYTGLLNIETPVVILSARGGHGFDEPNPPFTNHLEPNLKTAFQFIGIEKFYSIAIEYQEYGGELLAKSIQEAESKTIELVKNLYSEIAK